MSVRNSHPFGAAICAACLLFGVAVAGPAHAGEEPSRWSFSLGASSGFQDFQNTRLPDRDGMFFQPGRMIHPVDITHGPFDHYKQSSTQSFDWSDFTNMGGSVAYQLLPWLSLEMHAAGMSGLSFERPQTIEIGYYDPGETLYYSAMGGGGAPELRPFCNDPATCEYYALEYHSFTYQGKGKVSGFTGMLSAKLQAPEFGVLNGLLKPYVTLGMGMVQMSATETGRYDEADGQRGYSFSDFNVIIPVAQDGMGAAARTGCDPCGTRPGQSYKFETRERVPMFGLGLGATMDLTENLRLEFGGGYTRPTGELKALRSYNLGANLFVRF